MNQKNINPKIVSLVAAAVVITVFAVVYTVFGPNSTKPADSKNNPEASAQNAEAPKEKEINITIEVVNSKGESVKYDVNTDANFLRGAMEDAEGLEFSGSEGAYGLTLETVNGEYADFKTAYWGTYVNGDYCMYGIDSQPVADGDDFKIEYTPLG